MFTDFPPTLHRLWYGGSLEAQPFHYGGTSHEENSLKAKKINAKQEKVSSFARKR
jgi:hypothetical protein